ncbi:MAG: hypothetical protein ABF586_07335 [Sporolactobacillus sp.]
MNVYGKSKMGRFMLIGGLVGGALSLMSRETREVWGHHVQTTLTNGGKLMHTVYENPKQVGRYFSVTGARLKGLAREVSTDFQQMVEHAEKARASTGSTYQYVMEAGSELGEIAGKIKRYGQTMSQMDQTLVVDTEEDALQRLENETTVPNPNTMNHASRMMQTSKDTRTTTNGAGAKQSEKTSAQANQPVDRRGNHSIH